MLKIPSFRKIDDVTVYQDDTVWYQFCLIPSLPTISRDRDGNPVFLLTTFQTTEQDDSGSQNASVGGGFMNLDVQFAVDEATTAAARAELQQWVNEEYARRCSDPQYASLADYKSPTPPSVILADPLYSGGTVKMLTTQSELLTTDRIAEAPASLVSGSTAVFNIDLTAAGASFMKQLMVNPDGSGKIDLTPVSVLYCLNMLARMPAVKINIVGDSSRIHETLMELSANNQDNPCTPSEVESYRETSTNTSTLKETGMVTVHIDKGDFSVPDEVLQELQDYAFELFDTMVQERFLVPAEGSDRPLEFEDEFPGSDGLDPGWAAILYQHSNYTGASLEVRGDLSSLGHLNGQVSSVRVRAGHRITLYRSTQFQGASQQFSGSVSSLGGGWNDGTASVKVWRPPTSRYKVQKTVNHATMHLEVALERSQVVEWPVVAQATLQTFFADATKEAMQRHVVHLTLDDFKSLGVTVRTFVDFAHEPIQAVVVQAEYSAKDETGDAKLYEGSWTFTAEDNRPERFNPPLIADKRQYRFRYQLIYDDGSITDFTLWESTTNRALNISARDPGRLELEASAASLNWDLVKSVVVRLAYGDATTGIQPVTKTFQLTPQTPSRKWEERFKTQVQGAVEVKLTYHMADEKVFEAKPQAVAVTETLFVVPPPQVDILNINLVPAGDWNAVSQVVVSLEYDAGQGRIYDKVYRLSKLTDSAEWQVLLQDPNRRSFRYKYLVIYKDGRSEDIAWQTKTGDQPISIQVKGLPVLKVGVNVSSFEGMAAAVVKFTYGGETSTLTFTDAGVKGWEAPRLPSGDTQYTYEVIWYPDNGDPMPAAPVVTNLTELVLQPPRQPKAGKLDVMIRGFAVDFEATPFVDVMLRWSDGQREEQHMVVLHKTQTGDTWSVDIGPSSQRQYHYDVIYNLADGSRVNGPSVDTEVPVISVMPYRPST
ncbi:peptidase inhibitor family I36 protein [Leptolyngbya sp. CCNP1308]|uniref:peptidase inhibitor family I36 protein n=1 Tax=Leptolyngbya sp. CCNP1308 TaxID=3110255 RepID=UPI002B1FF901|nr:peptidase inhibitor family I36 protein [Leptolyngbya sp. CCNP1308]MEA5451778.1 peptidase inhibitor family I36 protein [Leptolyngbya sp. CCNP1308]